MKRVFFVYYIITGFFLLLSGCTDSNKKIIPHYRLQVQVEPELQKLSVKVFIQNAPTTKFYLNKNLVIQHILADGRKVSFHPDSLAEPRPYSVGIPIQIESGKAREWYIEYSGAINGIVNGVNMINPVLVELAGYTDWFPSFADMGNYTFDMSVSVPAGFTTTTNGTLTKQYKENGQTITEWQSLNPYWDIVLVSSPKMHKLSGGNKKLQVEMFYNILPQDSLQGMMNSMIRGFMAFSELYGPSQAQGVLRFVYSPRAGWGYSRVPLFMVSEDWAMQQLKTPLGKARTLHGSYHEMAHFWWMMADTATPDDWINEGLAEFSAFRLSEAYAGKAFADTLVAEYRRNAAASQTQDAIAETENGSPDRYVNRYEKTTLMFIETRQRFGEDPLNDLLLAFHSQYAANKPVTTATFLHQIELNGGDNVAAFLRDILYKKGWRGESL